MIIKFRNVFSIIILTVLAGCSMAGWSGYYKMKYPAKYSEPMDFNIPNSVSIENYDFDITLPEGCSLFATIGILTPFTPPFPIPIPRNNLFSSSDCNYFTIYTQVLDSEIILKTNENTYRPMKPNKSDNKLKYTFPVKAKEIDSGLIIIKKNNQIVEVPFEYKYFRFWY